MLLEKVSTADKIEVVENGIIQVRIKTAILEDGEPISNTYQRYMIAPGDDYSQENERVRAVCAAVHTPELIAAYKALLTKQSLPS